MVSRASTRLRKPATSQTQTLGVIASGQMKIYLTDQAENFDRLLKELMTKPTMTFDKTKLREKTTTIDIKTKGNLGQLNLDFLFDYKIFPSSIMTFMTQWGQEKRKMKIGDAILQQVYIPPTKPFSQKIVFGVRINSIIDEAVFHISTGTV